MSNTPLPTRLSDSTKSHQESIFESQIVSILQLGMFEGTVVGQAMGVLHRMWDRKSGETGGKVWCYYKSFFSHQSDWSDVSECKGQHRQPVSPVVCMHVSGQPLQVGVAPWVTVVGHLFSIITSEALAFHSMNTVVFSPHEGEWAWAGSALVLAVSTFICSSSVLDH